MCDRRNCLIVALILAFPSIQCCLLSAEKPHLEIHAKLVLPEIVQTALENYDSTFSRWEIDDYLQDIVDTYQFTSRQALSIVIGDFNGDRINDVALDGHNSHDNLLICILSDSAIYKVIEISRTPYHDPKTIRYDDGYGIWDYLYVIDRQTISSPFEEAPLKLPGDAIGVCYWGKASKLLYYRDGKFFDYITGD